MKGAMPDNTFAATLETMFPSKPSAGQIRTLRDEPSQLSQWAFARLLLDGPPEQASAWLDDLTEQIASKKEFRHPLSPVMYWTALAAVAELLGRPGREAAERALQALPEAEKHTDQDLGLARLDAHALALHAYLGNADAAAWRERFLALPLLSFSAPTGFYLLYLSSGASSEDDTERLSLEVARVFYEAVTDLLQEVGPLFLLLHRHARDHQQPLERLHGAIHRLDEAAPRSGDGGRPSLSFTSPSFRRTKRKAGSVLHVDVRVEGAGQVRVGPHHVAGLTGELAKRLYDHITHDGSRKAAASTKVAARALEASLVFDGSKVELPDTERQALQRRFRVAFDQAKAWLPGLRCDAELVFREDG
jgi:hypothetical protein